MNPMKSIHKAMALLLCCCCLNAQGAESPKQQLSSMSEIDQKYARWYVTEAPGGIEYFVGKRKDLDPKYTTKKELLKFDKNGLQVSPLLSKEQSTRFFDGPGSIQEIASDATGHTIAVVLSSPKANGDSPMGIILINTDTGDVKDLVNDGRMNYGPSFSPDGRYVAYYSTNSDLGLDPKAAVDQNAGCVVNLSTKKTKRFISPYVVVTSQWLRIGRPVWVDNNRVVYSTCTSGRPPDEETTGVLSGDPFYYVAVANIATEKVTRLFMPGGYFISVIVDRSKERLIFHNLRQVVQTEYDLTKPVVLVEVGASQKVGQVKLENGELKYKIWDK